MSSDWIVNGRFTEGSSVTIASLIRSRRLSSYFAGSVALGGAGIARY